MNKFIRKISCMEKERSENDPRGNLVEIVK